MTTRTTKQFIVVGLAGFLVECGVLAQDSRWAGTIGNDLWNVATNWNPVGVPPPGGTNFVGNVYLDPANGDPVITIPPGDVESPGVPPPGSTEELNAVYGPEFGAILDVYGTLNFDWTVAPTQPDPAPGNRSYLNMYTNSVLNCLGASGTGGASLNLGDGWWPFLENSPFVTMNMYANARYNSPGGSGLWLGGHLNIYDSAVFYVNNYVNMDVLYAQSDGTRSLVMGGGTLALPENSLTGGNSGPVTNWIARGILRAYGKGMDTNDLIFTDGGTNILVTTVPLGGALQRVYFQPLSKTNVEMGAFQQVTLVGDYPAIGGVLLSSSEPGLDPVTFSHPVYTSSNPKVASVDTNGLLTAVSPGKATLTATVGAFTSTNTVSVTVSPIIPNLIHRYSFKDTSGSTSAVDSIGGPTWAGAVNGDAVLSGSNLVLSGDLGSSVTLPAGIVSGLDEITIEAWVDFPSAINPYANLFAFGNTDGNGNGENAITFSPHTGATPATFQANFAQGDPGFNGERDAVATGVLDNSTNMQIVVVYHPYAGFEGFYTNGVLAASVSMFNNMIDPVAYAGPTYNSGSILPYVLGADPINYIGQSIYFTDPGLLANYYEFRIYNTPLTPAQIAADYALGPNQVIGTSTNVTLKAAAAAGGKVTITWPTSSALVSLVSSPALRVGATWTPVTAPMTVVGGNYQVVMPASSTAQFFRLTQ
jgi:hypothetical protein